MAAFMKSFFTDPQPKHLDSQKENKKSTTTRKTRSDKRHNVKFPITPTEHQLLRIAFKQASEGFKCMNKKELTQTLFNTSLLTFALSHLEIVDWNKPYKDTCTPNL